MRLTGWKEGKINTKETSLKRSYDSHCPGELRIVGIGPGDTNFLSKKAREAIDECQVVVGYKTYLKLLGNLVDGKEIISSGMTEETKRAKLAIAKTLEGKKVCLVSSGDPGIYGMAGVVLECLSKEEENKIKVEIIPAISAAFACAALLGAPLMHDFAVISLSDLLTPVKLIEQRIKMAAQGDFVIVFYNPKSKKRVRPLEQAWEILMKYKSPETPVGIVRNAQRDKEKAIITTLKNMLSLKEKIDMGTTIIVGNSQTYVKGKYIITPRGYPPSPRLRRVPRKNVEVPRL